MNLPVYSYELISPSLNLVLALLIGIAFGFVLERGGLGNAKKLIDQFLLKDLLVFKVMFSAIITAMLGLFFLSAFGFLNLQLIEFSQSYIAPQIVGGLLLGCGFAIAGYCPGTTIVGMACGKIDALVCFAGIFIGSWIFSINFEWLENFYSSTHLEASRLMGLFSVKYGTLVFVVSLIAIASFYAAEKIESRGRV